MTFDQDSVAPAGEASAISVTATTTASITTTTTSDNSGCDGNASDRSAAVPIPPLQHPSPVSTRPPEPLPQVPATVPEIRSLTRLPSAATREEQAGPGGSHVNQEAIIDSLRLSRVETVARHSQHPRKDVSCQESNSGSRDKSHIHRGPTFVLKRAIYGHGPTLDSDDDDNNYGGGGGGRPSPPELETPFDEVKWQRSFRLRNFSTELLSHSSWKELATTTHTGSDAAGGNLGGLYHARPRRRRQLSDQPEELSSSIVSPLVDQPPDYRRASDSDVDTMSDPELAVCVKPRALEPLPPSINKPAIKALKAFDILDDDDDDDDDGSFDLTRGKTWRKRAEQLRKRQLRNTIKLRQKQQLRQQMHAEPVVGSKKDLSSDHDNGQSGPADTSTTTTPTVVDAAVLSSLPTAVEDVRRQGDPLEALPPVHSSSTNTDNGLPPPPPMPPCHNYHQYLQLVASDSDRNGDSNSTDNTMQPDQQPSLPLRPSLSFLETTTEENSPMHSIASIADPSVRPQSLPVLPASDTAATATANVTAVAVTGSPADSELTTRGTPDVSVLGPDAVTRAIAASLSATPKEVYSPPLPPASKRPSISKYLAVSPKTTPVTATTESTFKALVNVTPSPGPSIRPTLDQWLRRNEHKLPTYRVPYPVVNPSYLPRIKNPRLSPSPVASNTIYNSQRSRSSLSQTKKDYSLKTQPISLHLQPNTAAAASVLSSSHRRSESIRSTVASSHDGDGDDPSKPRTSHKPSRLDFKSSAESLLARNRSSSSLKAKVDATALHTAPPVTSQGSISLTPAQPNFASGSTTSLRPPEFPVPPLSASPIAPTSKSFRAPSDSHQHDWTSSAPASPAATVAAMFDAHAKNRSKQHHQGLSRTQPQSALPSPRVTERGDHAYSTGSHAADSETRASPSLSRDEGSAETATEEVLINQDQTVTRESAVSSGQYNISPFVDDVPPGSHETAQQQEQQELSPSHHRSLQHGEDVQAADVGSDGMEPAATSIIGAAMVTSVPERHLAPNAVVEAPSHTPPLQDSPIATTKPHPPTSSRLASPLMPGPAAKDQERRVPIIQVCSPSNTDPLSTDSTMEPVITRVNAQKKPVPQASSLPPVKESESESEWEEKTGHFKDGIDEGSDETSSVDSMASSEIAGETVILDKRLIRRRGPASDHASDMYMGRPAVAAVKMDTSYDEDDREETMMIESIQKSLSGQHEATPLGEDVGPSGLDSARDSDQDPKGEANLEARDGCQVQQREVHSQQGGGGYQERTHSLASATNSEAKAGDKAAHEPASSAPSSEATTKVHYHSPSGGEKRANHPLHPSKPLPSLPDHTAHTVMSVAIGPSAVPLHQVYDSDTKVDSAKRALPLQTTAGEGEYYADAGDVNTAHQYSIPPPKAPLPPYYPHQSNVAGAVAARHAIYGRNALPPHHRTVSPTGTDYQYYNRPPYSCDGNDYASEDLPPPPYKPNPSRSSINIVHSGHSNPGINEALSRGHHSVPALPRPLAGGSSGSSDSVTNNRTAREGSVSKGNTPRSPSHGNSVYPHSPYQFEQQAYQERYEDAEQMEPEQVYRDPRHQRAHANPRGPDMTPASGWSPRANSAATFAGPPHGAPSPSSSAEHIRTNGGQTALLPPQSIDLPDNLARAMARRQQNMRARPTSHYSVGSGAPKSPYGYNDPLMTRPSRHAPPPPHHSPSLSPPSSYSSRPSLPTPPSVQYQHHYSQQRLHSPSSRHNLSSPNIGYFTRPVNNQVQIHMTGAASPDDMRAGAVEEAASRHSADLPMRVVAANSSLTSIYGKPSSLDLDQQSSTIGASSSIHSYTSEDEKARFEKYEKMSEDELGLCKKKYEMALEELVHTEEVYVNNLSTLVELYYKPIEVAISSMRRPPSEKEDNPLAALFCNLLEIKDVSARFLHELKQAMVTPNAVGGSSGHLGLHEDFETSMRVSIVILGHLDGFAEPYATYSANHMRSLTYLAELQRCVNATTIGNRATPLQCKVWDCIQVGEKDPRSNRQPIKSYLMFPIQRIMRYPIMIREIQKHAPIIDYLTWAQHRQRQGGGSDGWDAYSAAATFKTAHEMSERVCEVVDYRSGELSNLRKLIELQGRIDWHSLLGVELHLCSFTPLLGMRRYIREGPMNKSSMSRKRIYAFLTNDMFILTLQWREGGRWLYELYHTPMQTCDIIIRVPELAMVSFASSEGGKSTKSQTANSAGDQQFSGIQSFEVIHTRSKETITLRTPDAAKWVKDLIKVSEVHYQAFKAAVESGMITIDRDRDKKKKKRNTHMLLTEEERNKIRQDIKPSHLSRKC